VVPDLQAEQPLALLLARIARHCNKETHEVQACLGDNVLSLANAEKTLEESGVYRDAELTVIFKKSVCVVPDDAISRYNRDYFCTVRKVLEVAHNTLLVEFCVQGDRFGYDDDPERSQLRQYGPLGSGTEIRFPSRSNYSTHTDRCIEGTLLYEHVDMNQTIGFTFGGGSYSEVRINLLDASP